MAKAQPKPPRPASAHDRTRDLSPRVAAMLGETARLIDRLDYDAAERALTGALVLAPTHAETLRLKGLLDHRRGRLAAAAETYQAALAARPDDATIVSQLGELKGAMGDAEGAVAQLRRACALAPDDVGCWFRLGVQLDALGMNDEALTVAERVLALDPRHRLGRLLLARSLHAQGRMEDTAREYRRLIAAGGPQAYQAWFSLIDLKTIRLDPAEVAALEKAARDPKADANATAVLNFALGKVYEDLGRHADALSAFQRANASKRRNETWDAAQHRRMIERTREIFSENLRSAPARLGREAIFVLGLPRSGTTLIEQILAAHPDVEGASELPDLPAVISDESRRRNRPFPEWVPYATPADWERLGRDYLARTARWRTRRPRSTDKLPNNWPLVGAIVAMLPGARIIDCRRDPLETCWSCYKQLFAPRLVRYSYDFADLAAYWHDYDVLCRFWVLRYPEHVRAQGYETLIEAPEREIADLLAFCDLPFDETCLRFHEAPRSVRTVSSGQVRKPLDRNTARAARYGELLAPLRDALARRA